MFCTLKIKCRGPSISLTGLFVCHFKELERGLLHFSRSLANGLGSFIVPVSQNITHFLDLFLQLCDLGERERGKEREREGREREGREREGERGRKRGEGEGERGRRGRRIGRRKERESKRRHGGDKGKKSEER